MQQGWDIVAPRADAVIESRPAFGCSPEAAIADLMDNSISAGANEISVDFDWTGADSTVWVADDADGMSKHTLVAVTRSAGRNS